MRIFYALLFALPLAAQHDMSNMPGMDMNHDDVWRLMFHGAAFITDVQQSGPRGGDKFFSTNWGMGMATHSLAGGMLTLESMLSLEPLTITNRQYPELFQTGETAHYKPIVDGQHPHNFVMEAAVRYTHPLNEKMSWELYLAPVGEPALGPVAYAHRASAAELPQATLGHHLQDSTHISYEVITAGLKRGMLHVEASGFHGTEPGENRWTVGYGGINSYSGRITVSPSARWSGQISAGHLVRPEAAEPGDQFRTTGSVTYTRGKWVSSAIWGRVHKTGDGASLNSYGVESVARFASRNYVTGRAELVDKDELLLPGSFRIGAYTAGYTRDFSFLPRVATGLGANVTTYTMPPVLNGLYGRQPVAVSMFLHFRLD